MIPHYIGEYLKAYFEVSSEDRRALLSDSFFEFDPMECKEEYLPFLAGEVGCEAKRVAISEAAKTLNQKGTTKALKASLKAWTDAKFKEVGEFGFSAVLTPTNKEFSFDEKNYGFLQKTIEANKNVRSVFKGFEVELFLQEDVKVCSGFESKLKVLQDVEWDVNQSEVIFFSEANIFCVNISTDIDKDLKPSENISFIQGAINHVSLGSTVSLDMDSLNNNKIQGAVIWQV